MLHIIQKQMDYMRNTYSLSTTQVIVNNKIKVNIENTAHNWLYVQIETPTDTLKYGHFKLIEPCSYNEWNPQHHNTVINE